MGALWRRRPVRILLVVVVLFAGAALTVRLLFPAEKIRSLAIERVAEATGAEVSCGEASLALWPRLRLVLADGRVAGTGDALTEAGLAGEGIAEYSLDLDGLEIDLAVGPLLRKRVETGTIRLVRPRLRLVTRETDADDEAPAGAGRPSTRTTAPPVSWELVVAGIEVRDGSAEFRRAEGGPEVRLEGWSQDVECADMAALIEGMSAFGVGARGNGPVATLGLRTTAERLRIGGLPERPDLVFEDLSLDGTLTVPAEADRLDLGIERFAWQDLGLGGEATVGPGAEPGTWTIDAKWKLEDLEGARLLTAVLPMLSPDAVTDEKVAAWLRDGPVAGGTITASGAFGLVVPPPTDWQAQDMVRSMAAQARLDGGRLSLPAPLAGAEARLAVTMKLADGVVDLGVEEAEIGDGAVAAAGTGRIDVAGATPRLGADLSGTVDVGALLAAAPQLAEIPETDDRPAATLRADGRVRWTALAKDLDVTLLAEAEALSAAVEAGSLPGVSFTVETGAVTVGGVVPGPDWHLAGVKLNGDGGGADFAVTGIDHPALAGDVSGRLDGWLPLPMCSLDLQLATVDLDALVETFATAKTTAFKAAGVVDRRVVERLLDCIAPRAFAQPGTGEATPPGELIPADMSVAFTGGARRVILQKAAYTEVALDGRLDDRVVEVASLSARRATGEIIGSGKVDYATDPWGHLSFAAEAKEVPAGALLEPYAAAVGALWQGNVSAVFGGDCSLRDKDAVLRSLSIGGDALSASGAIDLTAALSGISSMLGDRQDLKIVRYREFTHNFSVAEGRYLVDGLVLKGLDTDWWGDGWIGFDGGIDMALKVKLPLEFRPDLGDLSFMADALRGDDGRIVLQLRLTGLAARPKVDLDLSLAKDAAQESIEEEVKKGLNGLLDKLKGK